MALKSKLRSLRRFIPLASALLLAALVAIPSSGVARAQAPPDELTLVNADRDFVERKKGGEKKRGDGWEYSWEYPDLDEHTELDRDRAYLLVMLAEAEDGKRGDFYAVVPIYQPGRIWDKILSALNPGRWARAFAGWMIEGVHGTLCGVVERASGEDADNCRRESGR